MGAYLSGAGPLIPTTAYVPILTGQYRIPALYTEVKGIFTNTVPVDAYRGAGRPEAMYLIERLVNKAAAALGVAPEELRRRNFVPAEAMPYTTPTGLVYDSGDFAAILDGAKKKADWDGFPARREAAKSRGRLAGIGMACYVEMTGGAPTEDAEIVFNADNTVSVAVGTMSNGQGHETAFAQLLAERLGVDFDKIEVVMGDTDRVKTGGGTGGSRSLHAEGGAIVVTTDKIIEKGKAVAANVLEAAVADIEFHEGRFGVAGTDIGIDILELASAARDPGKLPEGMEPGLDATGRYEMEGKTYPNGCHICEVEVDPETGVTEVVRYTVVDDLGNVVNPLLVAGQVHGGVAQGLGQALMEETVYDDNGQLLSGSYMDYCMPRADDIPGIDFEMLPTLCTTNPLGTKGCGEAGAIGAPAAAINAIENALAGLGIGAGDIAMPATPHRLWVAIRKARAA
jgi:carbon-monoxide dehydrogenase large subunit